MLLVPFLSPPLASCRCHPPSPSSSLPPHSPSPPKTLTSAAVGSLPSSRPLPLSCPNPSGCRLWLAASEGQSAKSPGPSDLTNAPKREGSHGSQRQRDLPGRTYSWPGRHLSTLRRMDRTTRCKKEAGGLEMVDSLPSRPYSPLPSRLPLGHFTRIHGAMVIDEGGGICWSGGRDASLDSRPGAASSARCPLPAAHSRASLSSAGALGAACVVAEPT